MRIRLSAVLGALLLCVIPFKGQAQAAAFTYQGRALDNGTNFNGSGQFKFALVTSNDLAFTTYWSNDGSSTNGSEPTSAVSVAVNGGLFTVILGNTNLLNMTQIPAAIFASQANLQLLIWFSDGVNGFAELMPAQSVTAVPYAAFAASAASVFGLLVQPTATNYSENVIGGSPLNSVAPGVLGATISGGGATNYFSVVEINSVIGSFGTVGGGSGNTAGAYATVSGGYQSSATNQYATVTGGYFNTASGEFATVAGGDNNIASGESATVAGGVNHSLATNVEAPVGGGAFNVAGGAFATVAGGTANTASGLYATVSGGYANAATSQYATVAGGRDNTAGGQYSFAAGFDAQAPYNGSFVWADDSGGFGGTPFSSTAANQFAVRAAGGVLLEGNVNVGIGGGDYRQLALGGGNSTGFLYGSYVRFADGVHLGYNYYANASGNDVIANTGGATSRLTVGYGFISLNVGGVDLPPTNQILYAYSGGVAVNGGFSYTSDRNAKQDFAPISSAEMLEKVVHLPISEWSYKSDASARHVGPVAQDFYSTFNLGTDDKHIAPVDEGGVALAAIQGLDRKVDERDQRILEQETQIEKQATEIEDLKAQIKELGQLVNTLNRRFEQTQR